MNINSVGRGELDKMKGYIETLFKEDGEVPSMVVYYLAKLLDDPTEFFAWLKTEKINITGDARE